MSTKHYHLNMYKYMTKIQLICRFVAQLICFIIVDLGIVSAFGKVMFEGLSENPEESQHEAQKRRATFIREAYDGKKDLSPTKNKQSTAGSPKSRRARTPLPRTPQRDHRDPHDAIEVSSLGNTSRKVMTVPRTPTQIPKRPLPVSTPQNDNKRSKVHETPAKTQAKSAQAGLNDRVFELLSRYTWKHQPDVSSIQTLKADRLRYEILHPGTFHTTNHQLTLNIM